MEMKNGRKLVSPKLVAFMNAQGEPWQELSCFVYSHRRDTIVGIYHKFAACSHEQDKQARSHGHGLNLRALKKYGFKDEETLIKHCQVWLKQFDIGEIYVIDASKFATTFDYSFHELPLPPYPLRANEKYSLIPKFHKDFGKPIHGIVCFRKFHSSYKEFQLKDLSTIGDMYTLMRGYACSLETAHELLLAFKECLMLLVAS